MNRSDFLIRGVINNLNIRFTFADTSKTVTNGIITHSLDPLAGMCFGKALTVGALISPMLNNDEKYSLRWEYEGKLGSILVDVNTECDLRGIPRETMLMETTSTNGELYGESGRIAMIKLEDGEVLNSGTSEAGMLDISNDIAFFLATSDQIETAFIQSVAFNADPDNPVNICSGLMIQALPDCDLMVFDNLRSNLESGVAQEFLIEKDIPVEKKFWKLVELAFDNGKSYSDLDKEFDIHYEFAPSPSYTCTCSQSKMLGAVKLLSDDELHDIFDSNDKPHIKCQFCNTDYTFSKDELGFE